MKKPCVVRFVALSCLFAPLVLAQITSKGAQTLPADAPQVQEEIKQIESVLDKLPDRGAALFLLAHDYAHLGQRDKALSLLKECISFDEGFDPKGDAEFHILQNSKEFGELVDRVQRRDPLTD